MVLHPYEQPRVLTCPTCGVPIASDALIEAGTRCIIDERPVAEMVDLRCPHCQSRLRQGCRAHGLRS